MEQKEKAIQQLLSWFQQFPESYYLHPNIEIGYIDHQWEFGAKVKASISEVPTKLIEIDWKKFAIGKDTISDSIFVKKFQFYYSHYFKQKWKLQFHNNAAEMSDDEETDDHSSSENLFVQNQNELFSVDSIVIYLFLIYETFVRKEQSFYFPYLQTLLQCDMSHFPLFFSDLELQSLKHTTLFKSLQSIQQHLKQSYEFFIPTKLATFDSHFFPLEIFTLERFQWAFTIFWSRCFPIQNSPYLLPLIDILNHQFATPMTYVAQSNQFALITEKPYLQIGEQVFNNYGAKSNDSFLLSYGFTIPNNSQDSFILALQMSHSEEDTSYEWKQHQIRSQQLPLVYYLKQSDSEISTQLMQLLCIMNQTELSIYFEEQNSNFTAQEKWRALHSLQQVLQGKLDQLQEVEDEEEDTMEEVSINMKNCMIYRRGQVSILEHYLQLISQHQNQFLCQELHQPIWSTTADTTEVTIPGLENHKKISLLKQEEEIVLQLEESCQPNEVLLTSSTCHISFSKHVLVNPVLQQLFYSSKGELDSHLLMALFIMIERRNNQSAWKHFFDACQLTSLPRLWTSLPSYLSPQMSNDKQEWMEDYSLLRKWCYQQHKMTAAKMNQLLPWKEFTFEQFCWALTIVQLFSCTIKEELILLTIPNCFILTGHPFGLFTFSEEDNDRIAIRSTIFLKEKQILSIKLLYPYLSMTEVLTQYGQVKPVSQLSTTVDAIAFHLPNHEEILTEDILEQETRVSLLQHYHCLTDVHYLTNEVLPPLKLALQVLIATLNEEEIQHWNSLVSQNSSSTLKEWEQKVMQREGSKLTQKYQQWKTEFCEEYFLQSSDDEQVEQKKNWKQFQTNVVQWLLSKKLL